MWHPEGAFAHAEQDQQRDRSERIAEEREADGRQDPDGALDDDEVARPEHHDHEKAAPGAEPIEEYAAARVRQRVGEQKD